MTDSSRALTPYLPSPAILSAHAKRGVCSIQLQLHREAMERRRRAMPALVAVKKPKADAVAKPKPVEPIPDLPALSAEGRLDLAIRRYKAKVAKLISLYAKARDHSGLPAKPRPSIGDIQRIVAAKYDVTVGDILSARRDQNIVRPRQVAYYLAKTLTLWSLPEIGRRFCGRDHTSVLSGYKKIVRLLAEGDDSLAEDIALLEQMLMGEIDAIPIRKPRAVAPPRKIGDPKVGDMILTAMRVGNSTAAEVALALDIGIRSAIGAISNLVHAGKIVRVRRVRERKRSYFEYALSEGAQS